MPKNRLNLQNLAELTPAKRAQLIWISPIFVVILGQVSARAFGDIFGLWGWLPLSMGYWLALFFLIMWLGGKELLNDWFRPSQGSRLWLLPGLAISTIPTVPMLFPDTWRLFFRVDILLATLLFVLINPLAEEGYWRGLLLSAVNEKQQNLAVIYSSLMFTINHMWIAIVASGARNPVASIFQFVFGLLMCLIYLRTRSLRWPLLAHFLTNLLTPTVAVFLNLYIPGAG